MTATKEELTSYNHFPQKREKSASRKKYINLSHLKQIRISANREHTQAEKKVLLVWQQFPDTLIEFMHVWKGYFAVLNDHKSLMIAFIYIPITVPIITATHSTLHFQVTSDLYKWHRIHSLVVKTSHS